MSFKLGKTKIYKNEILFLVAYICFFISLFLNDVRFKSDIYIFTRNLRYFSYFIALIQLIIHKENYKQFIIEMIVLAVTMVYYVFTNDIYLPMLAVLIFGSIETSEERVCNISLRLLTLGTLTVVIGNLVGIFPDVMTSMAYSTDLTRHSYGFYHSNVLPNNLLIIEILLVWKYKKKFSIFWILIFLVLNILIYDLSRSRMSIVISIIFTLGLISLKLKFISLIIEKVIYIISFFITPILTILSVVFMLLVNSSNFLVYRIDLIFSSRFWAAFLKYSRLGIKLFNFSSNEFFYYDKLIIDNGYLFLLLRYGVIALVVINFISINLVMKSRNQIYRLICIINIFTIASIDNLFLSYRFLPFLIFAFLKINKKLIFNEKGEYINE
ncbi:MAG: hypothetical protein E6Z21_01775 [Anaerococcus vaginalis]|nr:hypothetical protein [Anaerococcus vaginalis]